MSTVFLYALLTAGGYYLFSRSKITSFAWSRYPKWLNEFALCSACVGFWLGALCGGLGWWLGLDFLGLASDHWFTIIAVALGSMVWTPPTTYVHLLVLEALSPPPEE